MKRYVIFFLTDGIKNDNLIREASTNITTVPINTVFYMYYRTDITNTDRLRNFFSFKYFRDGTTSFSYVKDEGQIENKTIYVIGDPHDTYIVNHHAIPLLKKSIDIFQPDFSIEYVNEDDLEWEGELEKPHRYIVYFSADSHRPFVTKTDLREDNIVVPSYYTLFCFFIESRLKYNLLEARLTRYPLSFPIEKNRIYKINESKEFYEKYLHACGSSICERNFNVLYSAKEFNLQIVPIKREIPIINKKKRYFYSKVFGLPGGRTYPSSVAIFPSTRHLYYARLNTDGSIEVGVDSVRYGESPIDSLIECADIIEVISKEYPENYVYNMIISHIEEKALYYPYYRFLKEDIEKKMLLGN